MSNRCRQSTVTIRFMVNGKALLIVIFRLIGFLFINLTATRVLLFFKAQALILICSDVSSLKAMEEQGQGSKEVLEAIGELNKITSQVEDTSRQMLEGSKAM